MECLFPAPALAWGVAGWGLRSGTRPGVVVGEVLPPGDVFVLPLEVLVPVLLWGAAGPPPGDCRRDCPKSPMFCPRLSRFKPAQALRCRKGPAGWRIAGLPAQRAAVGLFCGCSHRCPGPLPMSRGLASCLALATPLFRGGSLRTGGRRLWGLVVLTRPASMKIGVADMSTT